MRPLSQISIAGILYCLDTDLFGSVCCVIAFVVASAIFIFRAKTIELVVVPIEQHKAFSLDF